MDKPKNGSWKLIGILITVFLTLIGYVVANDRIRASEDIRIIDTIDLKIEKVEVRVDKKLDNIQMEQRIQGKVLSRIEAKLE